MHIGCSIGSIQCVDMKGVFLHDRRSRYYKKCESGQWSDTMLVPDEKVCYLGSLYSSSFCGGVPPQPECSFTGFRCINENGVLTDSSCSSQYCFSSSHHI